MRIIPTGCFMAVGLMAWLVGSAQPPQAEYKQLEELLSTHEAVSVTSGTDGVFITLVKGAEVYRCKIFPFVDPNNPSAWKPGYNIICHRMKEADSSSPT